MANVMRLHLSKEEAYVFEHADANCIPLCSRGIHPVILLNILMPKYQQTHLNTKCQR